MEAKQMEVVTGLIGHFIFHHLSIPIKSASLNVINKNLLFLFQCNVVNIYIINGHKG